MSVLQPPHVEVTKAIGCDAPHFSVSTATTHLAGGVDAPAMSCDKCNPCPLGGRGVLVNAAPDSLSRADACSQTMCFLIHQVRKFLGLQKFPEDAIAFENHWNDPSMGELTHHEGLMPVNPLGNLESMPSPESSTAAEDTILQQTGDIREPVCRCVFRPLVGPERIAMNCSQDQLYAPSRT